MKNNIHSKNSLNRKSYARIFTDTEEHARQIKKIMMEIDPDEMMYFPEDLIHWGPLKQSIIGGKPHYYIPLTYTGKFDDMDMNEVQLRCMLAGIPIAVWENDRSIEEAEFMLVDIEKED